MNTKDSKQDRIVNKYFAISFAILLVIMLAAMFASIELLERINIHGGLLSLLSALISVASFLIGYCLIVENILKKILKKKLEEIEKSNAAASN